MIRVFGHYLSGGSFRLACIETVAVLVTFLAAKLFTTTIVFGQSYPLFGEQALLVLFCITTLTVAMSLGLNNKDVFIDKRRFVATLVVTAMVSYVLIAIVVSISELALEQEIDLKLHYAVSLLALILFVVVVFVSRSVLLASMSGNGNEWLVAIIGAGDRALKLDSVKDQVRGPFAIAAFIPVEGEESMLGNGDAKTILPSALLASPDSMLDRIRDLNVDEIVIATRERRGLPMEALLEAKFQGVPISDFSRFWEMRSGQLDFENLEPSWLILSDGFRDSLRRRIAKRTFDIVVSALVLLVTLPITLIAALAIKLDSAGPVFYSQKRVGLNGRVFDIHKFRSMRADAEKDGVARWATTSDDRVTRTGRFMRLTRIDEIPQVLNVLIGDMSFVGPRPERPVFVETLSEKLPYYRERHRVKPGITGWAQINFSYAASEEDTAVKLAYDLYYVKNWDLFLDGLILSQTVRVVFWQEGAR